MVKKISSKLLVCFILFCFAAPAWLYAETSVSIAVLPFSVDAVQNAEKIKEKIVSILSERLESEGAKILMPEIGDYKDIENLTFEQLREIGIKSGADYVLKGSIFVAGSSLSIDSTLYNIYEKDEFTSIYSDAENLENLFSAVSSLGKGIIGRLFKEQIILDIAISGNRRVESDAILGVIDSKAGDIMKPGNVSKDLKKIYGMGYFDNVVAEKQSLDNGVKLIFKITEKSTVRKVLFKNNNMFESEELSKIVSTRTGSILNIYKINSDVDRLHLMYTEKNYHNCSVTYEIMPLENDQADVVFSFKEGKKLKVEKITFEGNTYFTDKKIKKSIQTKEKGFFSFLTSSGDLNEVEVKNDAVRIESLYKNSGFIDAKVTDPDINIGENYISINFKIEEGYQFKINKVELIGDLILSEKEILEQIQLKKGALYNREVIIKDVNLIIDIYSDKGFAGVRVDPIVDRLENEKLMNISYSIAKGEPVYFDRVNISGNSKTRDKVIRREIKIVEQDLYSKKKIQQSFKDLNRLNYFSQIDVKPVETPQPNRMDLDVKVAEKETGSFMVGGGFSSYNGGFVSGSIQENNLFGKGQTLKFEATLAQESILYDVNFFEPYIMDTNVSGGINVYKEEREYDYYDKDSLGLTLKLGYKLYDYTRIGINYNIEDFEISDVEPAFTNMTPGSFLTSRITPFIKYDSRDDLFLPTEGMVYKTSIEYAGEVLGGDIDYTKYLAEAGVFFPLFWKFTGALHTEAGYLDDRTDSTIDIDYIRFYLGGMNSIRGFDKYDINGRRSGDAKDIGGEKYIQFNAELTFPVTDKYRLAAVIFYDRGDVYRTSEDIDLGDQFSSCGLGFRWDSPVGPIRIEYGWVIDGKDVKDSGDGQFEFSVGASF